MVAELEASEGASPDNSLQAAQGYVARGWTPIPLPFRSKAPQLSRWQRLHLTEADLPAYFNAAPQNIGVLLGEPSDGLADIDLDASEACALADLFLPATSSVFGRAGKPRSHRLYVCSIKTEKFADVDKRDDDKSMLVEIRSTGSQTIFPPSTHPSGERVEWRDDGKPAPIEADDLRRTVVHLACAAILARHWPGRGVRHEAALAAAGFLARLRVDGENVVKIVTAGARGAGDDEWSDRKQAALDTIAAIGSGEAATGGPRLADLLLGDGPKVVERMRRWLGVDDEGLVGRGEPASAYLVRDGRLCRRRRTKDATLVEPLCNFSATVTEELVLDDGAETTRAFIVEGQLDTGERLPTAQVSAGRFAGMAWVTDSWGLRAVVRAGMATRDYLREAIQTLSPTARARHIFTHTGWREVDGGWLYLMSNGAVGRGGYEVNLGPELTRYCLPPTIEDVASAMRSSLRLLHVAPLRVTAPLWALTFRAPLASVLPADVSGWLEGQTGSLKSTLAALFLSHFGTFDRLHLPGAWSSTANQLERRAFVLKDALFVIDDYAPASSDPRDLNLKAARLLRAQGNLAGRGRLRADLSERPAFPPRGLILATAEEHPPGQSVLARIVVIELDRTDVDLAAVSAAQAETERLPHAMAGYVAWLTPQMPTLAATLRQTFAAVRSRASADGEHLRVPEALAHLYLGLECGLAYAVECGACSSGEARELRAAAWEALLSTGRAQGRLVEEERPSRRFLSILLTLVTQGRATLRDRDDDDDHRAGNLVGWMDDEYIYLLPEASWHAVSHFCRDTGEPFPTREAGLRRALVKEGLSDPAEGRLTASVLLGGRKRRVLRIDRLLAEKMLGEEFPEPAGTGGTGHDR